MGNDSTSLHALTGLAALFVTLGAIGGCDPSSGAPPGRVAFSALSSAEIVVVDRSSGATHRIATPGGRPGSLAFSRSGDHVAFSFFGAGNRRAFVADIDTGTVIEITPGSQRMVADFHWSGDAWFYFATSDVSTAEYASFVASAPDWRTRRVGLGVEPTLVTYTLVSPSESRLSYGECASPVEGTTCPMHLVTERGDGTEQRTLADDLSWVWPLAHSPDGRFVGSYEGDGEVPHLMLRPVDGSDAWEIGDSAPGTTPAYDAPGGTLFSPDGEEILAIQDDMLVAVNLDTRTARVVSSARPGFGMFTATGAVLYDVPVNTNPGTDLPRYVHTTFLSDDGRSEAVLGERDSLCEFAALAPDGAAAALRCGEVDHELVVYALPEAREIWRGRGLLVLALDDGASGMVFAEPVSTSPIAYEIRDVRFGGGTRLLGTAGYSDAHVDWPLYDYAVQTP